MNSRTRIIITATMLCHLLLAVPVVTCQLPNENPASAAPSSGSNGVRSALDPKILPSEEVTIRARQQEKQGMIYRLRGDVEVTFQTYTVRADEVTYNSEDGQLTATGNVIFDGGPSDSHVEASRATYNIKTEDGTFHDVLGSVGARVRGSTVILTTSNPFIFTGKEVRKVGRDRFIVLHGSVTSCQLPNPKWTFEAEKIDVVAGEDAKIYHSTFRIRSIPIFYFPYASHPAGEFGRKSGFLLPSFGQSSRKGFIAGESVYWAINRSMDLTAGAEYYSRRGWAPTGEFRARPGENSYINMRYNSVLDRGAPGTGEDQGGHDVRLDSELELPYGFRAVANVNYLSSFLFRLAFSETFTQAVNSEVRSTAFISKNTDGFSFDVMASRYQNFQSTRRGDRILLLHMPTLEMSTVERRFLDSRVMWAFDATAEGVSRREPDFVTGDLVGRFDVRPRASLPMVWKGWSVRPEIALRNTYYTQQQVPNLEPNATTVGTPISENINRRAIETSVEVRPPALARVFDREVAGRKLKHVIEPRIIYDFVKGVDQFRNIIRFDARDVLSNTSEVELGIVQRIYAKRSAYKRDPVCDLVQPESDPENRLHPPEQTGAIPGTTAEPLHCEDESSTREIVTWELKQRYFFNQDFDNAIIPGRRNVLTTTAEFTGIAFLTEPRVWSPIVSRLRIQTSANTDIQWQLDYDFKKGRINSSTAFVDHRIRNFFIGGSHALLHVPGEIVTTSASETLPNDETHDVFNQFRALLGYGYPGKRGFNAGASIGFDTKLEFLQYSAFQTSYNWDCCGLSVEYRRFALGRVRNENQLRFAFTLANVGTFGNLRRQERLF